MAWSGERFGDAANRKRPARLGVDLDERALKENAPRGDAEFLRRVLAETLDDWFDLTAQNAVVGAGEPGICQVGGAAGENLFVRCLHMSMSADDGADLAVQHSGDGDFFGRCLGMHVNKNDFGEIAEAGNFGFCGEERIFQRRHEGPSLKVKDGDRRLAFRAPDETALADCAGWIIERTQEARLGLEQHGDFFLIPKVVASGDDIDARVEKFVGSIDSDAGAAGGVFSVGDDDIDIEALA